MRIRTNTRALKRPRHPVAVARAQWHRRLLFVGFVGCLVAPLFVRFPVSELSIDNGGASAKPTMLAQALSPLLTVFRGASANPTP